MSLDQYPNLRASLGQRVAQNLARTLDVRKGVVHRRKDPNNADSMPMAFVMFAWDACDPCRHAECPIHYICEPPENTAMCIVQKKYLKGVALAIGDTYIENMVDSQALAFRIGTELFPLYKMLVKLKMVELTILDPVIDGLKVGPRIHPIFKEIRETINTIDRAYVKLGLAATNKSGGPDVAFPPELGSYYENMEQEEWGRKEKE